MYLIYGARNSKSKNGMKKKYSGEKKNEQKLAKIKQKGEREMCMCNGG
jgi:hypothetical protein